MLKIVLVEDHQIVRDGIKTLLEREEDFQVVGEAGNGLQALAILEAGMEPDILLVDISMPEMDGISLSKEVRDRFPRVKVVILSMMDNEKYIYDALALGVKGYLLKNASIEEIVFALKYISKNNRLISAELGIRMLQKATNPISQSKTVGFQLSSRELEILNLIAEGLSSQEIADKTFTSKRTVEGHRQNLLYKAGVKNTAQLIRHACNAGLL